MLIQPIKQVRELFRDGGLVQVLTFTYHNLGSLERCKREACRFVLALVDLGHGSITTDLPRSKGCRIESDGKQVNFLVGE